MTSEQPREGRCAAKCRSGGYCESYPVQGSERCRMHGGTNQGNPDAEGAAISHGATADPLNLKEHLDDEAKAWVEGKVTAYLDEKGLDRDTPDGDLVELAVMSLYQARSAHGVLFDEGLSRTAVKGTTEHGAVTDEEEHYLNRVVSQHTTDFRMALKDAGALDDPESQKAEATKSLAELLSE